MQAATGAHGAGGAAFVEGLPLFLLFPLQAWNKYWLANDDLIKQQRGKARSPSSRGARPAASPSCVSETQMLAVASPLDCVKLVEDAEGGAICLALAPAPCAGAVESIGED